MATSTDERGQARSPYMTMEEAAQHCRVTPRTMGELARLGRVPHRKAPGSRRCLFLAHEIDAWMSGAGLEVRELPEGGRVVKVVVP